MATNWIVSTHAAVYEDTGKSASAGQKVIKLVPVPEGVKYKTTVSDEK